MSVHHMTHWLAAILAFLVMELQGAVRLPEKPRCFFNDNTGHVSRGTADRLNELLAQYERESSNQLLVAVYSRIVGGSSIEDYCAKTFESWGVGRADRDNGAVLFVFTEDRKMRIQTGYGLEASLTDAECFRIIKGLKPFFRTGDYNGGLIFAVKAMIEATKGEYRGTGETLAESRRNSRDDLQTWLMLSLLLFMIMVVVVSVYQVRVDRGYVYDSKRPRSVPEGRWWTTFSRSSGSGGGWSGGGGWGGGGGSSWSGGGGSTGGGGASGGW